MGKNMPLHHCPALSIFRRKLLLLVSLIVATLGHHGESVAQADQIHEGRGFTISYPDTIAVFRAQAIDFELLTFLDKTTNYLSLYAGHAPSFPVLSQDLSRGTKDSTFVRNLPAFAITWHGPGDLLSREILIELPTEPIPTFDFTYVTCLHLWYYELSEDEVSVAESILGSVQLTIDVTGKSYSGTCLDRFERRGRSQRSALTPSPVNSSLTPLTSHHDVITFFP